MLKLSVTASQKLQWYQKVVPEETQRARDTIWHMVFVAVQTIKRAFPFGQEFRKWMSSFHVAEEIKLRAEMVMAPLFVLFFLYLTFGKSRLHVLLFWLIVKSFWWHFYVRETFDFFPFY
jgi:hypothetical protein